MRISYSGIETYRTCPLKFKFREIDKISEPKSKEAVFGTLIHATMRFIHEPAILLPTVEQALDYFSRNWNDEIWESELEERAAFSGGVSIIQKYYETIKPGESTIIDLESRFALEITSRGDEHHVVSGIIDRIDKIKDGYEIIDYKTARKMPSQEKVDHDLQLSIYLKAFLNRYPNEWDRLDSITVSLYYLKHSVKLSSKRTKADLEKVDELILSVVDKIKSAQFEPILSPLCDWCGYQRICPLWKHKFPETRPRDQGDIEPVIKEFLSLRSQIGIEKQRLAELQEIILRYMDSQGVERLFDDTSIIGKSVRKTFRYDEKRLREILLPLGHWDNVLKVDSVSLRSVIDLLDDKTRSKIEEAREVKESIALSVKKSKEDSETDLVE